MRERCWNRSLPRERDKKAALKFMKKLMKRHGCARTITTDGLRSYGAAMKELGIADRQEIGRYANNRAENSHQPFRRRERAMLRFRQMKTLQKFSSVHAAFHNHFNQERHLVSRNGLQGPKIGCYGRVGARCWLTWDSAPRRHQRLVAVGLTAPRTGILCLTASYHLITDGVQGSGRDEKNSIGKGGSRSGRSGIRMYGYVRHVWPFRAT